MHNARKGNTQAFAQLYQQYSKAMYNICIRMAGNIPEAEDLLQESFITAFNNIHQLKEDNFFGGWLKTIVVNNCIKHCKKIFYWDDWSEEKIENIANDETEWWVNIEMNHINHAIKQLPDGCREIFTLYAIENYSHKEVANNLGISESTSKSQYHRAKKLLKEKLINQL
ncbi:MAG: sigma-70 family RNA polymerase sigma factor [Bacteroidetes bacterium]|nr:sigma-70 family RNA polymerase sigma factor [Bacteroidota bacterium]MBS1649155.1 sigma-70 family RNA polymerase sigma factor [Bacteroidota bacterium]